MARDVSALTAERNVLRYVATPVLVRLADGGSLGDLVRVVAAGALAGAPVRVSSGVELPAEVAAAFAAARVSVLVEDDAAFHASASRLTGRVRLIGGDVVALAAATGGRPDLAVYAQPVTEAGRVEMLPFLREQAISLTAHRFGTPDDLADRALALL